MICYYLTLNNMEKRFTQKVYIDLMIYANCLKITVVTQLRRNMHNIF